MMRLATTTIALVFSLLSSKGFVSGQFTVDGCDFGPQGVNNALPLVGLPGTAPQTCFQSGGIERCYYTYIPASCGTSSQKVPLVVDIHGSTGCPSNHILITGWAQRAEEECFVVLYPSASMDDSFKESCFNLEGFALSNTFGTPTGNNVLTTPCCCADNTIPDGQFGSYDTPDDTTFVKEAIDHALNAFPNDASGLSLDAKRVYMGGFSNGCMTSLSVAAKHSDTVAAVCCQAGALITGFANYNPVPIHMLYGRLDTRVPYDGLSATVPGALGPIGVWSHDETYNYLQAANGCMISGISSFEDPDSGDTIGSIVELGGCINGADVQFITLDQAGHSVYPTFFIDEWGGSQVTTDVNKLAWDFCKVHSKGEPPTEAPTRAPTTKSEKKKAEKKGKAGKKTKAPKKEKR